MSNLICARCRRRLFRDPIMVAGMPLGPKCAATVAGAASELQRRPGRIERRVADREAAFNAAQLDIFAGAPA